MHIRTALLTPILCLALIASGCAKPNSVAGAKAGGAASAGKGGKNGPQPIPVLVAPVQRKTYAPAIVLQGDIRAAQETTLAAEVAGKVITIAHRVGEKHAQSAGALIRVDPATYDTTVASAKANLAQALETLKRLENGPRLQEIAAQEAAVASAQAKYNQAQDNLQRQQELFDQGAIAETALVDARTAGQTAKAALDAAQQVLDALRQGSRSEDIAAARASADQARSSLAAAELQRSRTAIMVPFNAIVTALFVEVGQYVGPGTPLCIIVADKPAEAWFNLPQADVAKVEPRAAVEIRVQSLPDAVFHGSVISVSPAADEQSRQFPVRVALEDQRLKPGMAVTGRILTAKPALTLVISDDAAFEDKLGLVVYRVVPAKTGATAPASGPADLAEVEMVHVELGEHLDGEVVLLKGDLKDGDMLVTRGKEQLYSSAKIIPTNLKAQDSSTKQSAAKPGQPGSAGGTE